MKLRLLFLLPLLLLPQLSLAQPVKKEAVIDLTKLPGFPGPNPEILFLEAKSLPHGHFFLHVLATLDPEVPALSYFYLVNHHGGVAFQHYGVDVHYSILVLNGTNLVLVRSLEDGHFAFSQLVFSPDDDLFEAVESDFDGFTVPHYALNTLDEKLNYSYLFVPDAGQLQVHVFRVGLSAPSDIIGRVRFGRKGNNLLVRWTGSEGTRYVVEGSSDAMNWSGVSEMIVGFNGEMSFTTATEDDYFVRVRRFLP